MAEVRERVGGVLERVAAVDHRADRPGVQQLGEATRAVCWCRPPLPGLRLAFALADPSNQRCRAGPLLPNDIGSGPALAWANVRNEGDSWLW
jgi:hypothetical protein